MRSAPTRRLAASGSLPPMGRHNMDRDTSSNTSEILMPPVRNCPPSPSNSMTKPILTSWGYTELDDVVGSLAPGRLYVIGGKPGNGKTTLLLNIVNAIYATRYSQPRRVFAWLCEMGREVGYRSWAALRLDLDEDAALMEQLDSDAMKRIRAEELTLQWEHDSDDDGGWTRFG